MTAAKAGVQDHRKQNILSYNDLKTRGIRFTRQWLLRLIHDGDFPQPIKLGQGHSVGFVESEIDDWIAKLIARRDEEKTAKVVGK
jgi:predicted DNA-binding transcriptional regulator AlpA